MERTLVIVKPDAVGVRQIGEVVGRFERAGLSVRWMKMVWMSPAQARGFYAVHRERPFFSSLSAFMSSGPSVVMVLEGEEAIARVRALMGATDPAKAGAGTIRRDLATSIERNVVHGSDSLESARFEIPYFFAGFELPADAGAQA